MVILLKVTNKKIHQNSTPKKRTKFKDHPFRCKMVLGAPDGPILVQNKPCTARLICTHNRPKLSYRGVFTILETQNPMLA